MPQVKESVEYLVKTKKRSIYSGPKFGKVTKCAAGVKSLRTTSLKDYFAKVGD